MSRFFVRARKLFRALLLRPRKPSVVRRVLVAHNLLLGDTLLLAPLLKAISLEYPDSERFLLVKEAFLPLFDTRPYGFKAIPFDRRKASLQQAVMDSGPYDMAFVPDDNRYAWLARASGARWVVAFAGDHPAWKNWMVDEAVPYAREPLAWADMVSTLVTDEAVAPFEPGEWSITPGDPPIRSGPYVVFHVGASTPLKQWPAARWRRLAHHASEKGLTVVWTGGRGEEGVLEDIGLADGEINMVGSQDLLEVWRTLHYAVALVCPDTGIGHLSRIVGVPAVVLFGPGSRTIHGSGRFFRKQAVTDVTVEPFACRNQDRLYRRTSPWVMRCGRQYGSGASQCPNNLCMQAISLEAVIQAFDHACSVTRSRRPAEVD